MFSYIFYALQNVFAAPFILLTCLAVVSLIACRLLIKKNAVFVKAFYLHGLSLGFAFLALTIGLLAGNSREAAVNTVVSSSLAFLGGIVVYIFSKKDPAPADTAAKSDNITNMILLVLLIFPVCLLYGISVGAKNRQVDDDDKFTNEYNAKLQSELYEYQLRVSEDSIKTFLEIYKDSVKVK